MSTRPMCSPAAEPVALLGRRLIKTRMSRIQSAAKYRTKSLSNICHLLSPFLTRSYRPGSWFTTPQSSRVKTHCLGASAMSISITRRVDSKSGVLVVFTMRLITMSFFLTAVCKQGDRKGVRARTHKATIHIWEFRSLVISAAKIIRLGKKDRPNQAKSKLLLWLNFVADLRTATTSLCTTSYGIVTFPERDVQVTGFRLARFCSNSKPPNRVAQSRKVDDTMEALLSKPARPRLSHGPLRSPKAPYRTPWLRSVAA